MVKKPRRKLTERGRIKGSSKWGLYPCWTTRRRRVAPHSPPARGTEGKIPLCRVTLAAASSSLAAASISVKKGLIQRKIQKTREETGSSSVGVLGQAENISKSPFLHLSSAQIIFSQLISIKQVRIHSPFLHSRLHSRSSSSLFLHSRLQQKGK